MTWCVLWAGVSQFLDPVGNTWNFSHPTVDGSFAFQPQTRGCPGANVTPCGPPQCASEFNMSPYGLWTASFPPDWYANGSAAVTQVVLQLQIQFLVNKAPDPLHPTIFFTGPDQVVPLNSPGC